MLGENLKIKEKQNELANLKEQYLIIFTEHEDLSKENIVLYNRYNFIFGEAFYERYFLYCELLRLKRKSELYQACINRQEPIDKTKIEGILETEFKAYEEKLERILEEYKMARDFLKLPKLSLDEVREIKRIYIKIAKRIHPDIDPDFDEAKKDLWQKTLDAYKINDLEGLKDCEFIFDNFLNPEPISKTEFDQLDKEINLYQDKIEELSNKNNYLVNTFPYDQKELLNNLSLIEEKRYEIRNDIKDLQESITKLENRIREIDPDYEKEIC